MHKTLSDLVIFGGRPSLDGCLYVNSPNFGDRDVFTTHINKMIDSRWFTNDGPLVLELEERLCKYLKVTHCILTCNGTLALQLTINALGLRGEVIVPSFTFVATAHALLWQGIEPIFCDIGPDTLNIDPDACEKLITSKTTAILGVHIWGRPCDTERLEKIARHHGLRLFFDAAHAFGCSHNARMIGGFGDAEVFSFHATKIFHTFEGGAIATNDDKLATRLKELRNFGFTGYDEVSGLGINAKMSEVSAAMGLTNLESIERHLGGCQRNHEAYRQELEGAPGLTLLEYNKKEKNNHQYVVLEVDEKRVGLTRDQLLQILQSESIHGRRYFYPGCHRMEPYVSRSPCAESRLPNTNFAARRVLVLPGGAELVVTQIEEVCEIIRLVISEADVIRNQWDSIEWEGVEPYANVLSSINHTS